MTDPNKRPPYYDDSSSEGRAQRYWADDPDGAICGRKLISAETDASTREQWARSGSRKKSKMVYDLAQGQPERFLELVEYLPHRLQDIFYQYYLLGRTQEQIGETLDMPEGRRQEAVCEALAIGIGGISAVAAAGRIPTRFDGAIMQAQWEAVMAYDTPRMAVKEIAEDERLGQFEIRVDNDVDIHFAPSTTDGAVRGE